MANQQLQLDENGNPLDPNDPNANRNALAGGLAPAPEPSGGQLGYTLNGITYGKGGGTGGSVATAPLPPSPTPAAAPTTPATASSGATPAWPAGVPQISSGGAFTPSPPPTIGTQLSGKTYGASGAGAAGDGLTSSDPMTRIKAALAAAGSTDDPNYWLQKVTGDPNGMGSAWDYWLGRINQGDGAAGVRNGTIQKFNDTPSGGAPGGGSLVGGGGPTGDNPFALNIGGGGGGYGFSSAGIAQDPATQMYNQNLRLQLLKQLGTLSTPETDQSQDVQPALSAYSNQSTRDQQTQRDALAERAYAQGGGTGVDSGAFNTAVNQNAENAAGQRANFSGNLVYQANVQRRQQLQQMMQTAVNAGQTDAAQQIQSQIAMLDAKLQEQGLQQGFATANNGLAFNYANLISNNNRDALLAALTGA